MVVRCWLLACMCLCAAAAPRVGMFEGHGDVGAVAHTGSANYDATRHTYTITGSGENMWFGKDEFYFVWRKVSGDFTLSADISFPAAGGNAHRKAVLMARQSLEADAAYVDVAVHGDGLTSLQARDEAGANTHEVGINAARPVRARLVKRGDAYSMWLAGREESLQFSGASMRVQLKPPFYVGLGVCAHDKNVKETAVFSDVELEEDVLHSTIETISVASTDRRVIYVAPERIESPFWNSDGKLIRFVLGGAVRAVDAAGGAPPRAEPTTPEATGRETRPPDDGFTNCFAQRSLDGRQVAWLAYAPEIEGCPADAEVMLRVSKDGQVRTLARFVGGKGSLDAGAWSPDGKLIVFVSYHYAPR